MLREEIVKQMTIGRISAAYCVKLGSPTWTRTRDLRINSPSLYQLSYQGIDEGAILMTESALVNMRNAQRARISEFFHGRSCILTMSDQ